MNKATSDLGGAYPGGHPSGRVWQPPVSVDQARVRMLNAMGLLEANCRDGIDVGYAQRVFNEAADDYWDMVLTGEVSETRNATMEAQLKELYAECAELQAEAVIRQAMRDIEDGEA